MSGDYEITTRCYIKLLMHTLKYPQNTVNGLLLAEKSKKTANKSEVQVSDGAADSTTVTGFRGRFVDIVPLFHLGHGLTPMIEAALLQVSTKCKERGLVIAGYYQANRYFIDSAPDVFAQRIAEKIWEQNNEAVLMMVYNFGLATSVQEESDAETALQLYTCNDAKWRHKGGCLSLENPKQAFDILNELIYGKQLHYELYDFDNHLDDITADWSNKYINTLIDNTINAEI